MNTYYIAGLPVTDELYHHGILGQKWGIRRYQNLDGTLTPAGKERYGKDVTLKSDARLKLQHDRLLYNNQTYPKKQAAAVRKFFNELTDISGPNGIPREKAIKLGEKFIRDLASVRLDAMGYEPSIKNIEYLSKQKWFRNSTMLNNTLASIGVSGVEYTHLDDHGFPRKISIS